jgi:U2-associated protein SR140
MWPRTAEEFSRGHNSGFVSFMHREDAHAAFQNLHDTNIDGHVVRLTWGRAQRRSAHPMKPLPGQQYGSSIKPYGMDEAIRRADLTLPVVLVQPPLDLVRRKDINILARSILQQTDDSQDYLAKISAEEHAAGNSRFSFLWDPSEYDGDDGIYYRWRLYSLEHGDTDTRWRTAPFAMFDGGPLWNPPPCLCPINNPRQDDGGGQSNLAHEFGLNDREAALESDIIGSAEEGATPDNQNILKALAQDLVRLDDLLDAKDVSDLGKMLNSLDTRRGCIAQAMVFCIDRSRCAGAVIAQILFSIENWPTDCDGGRQHLSLLFLISDILCNSGNAGVPRASTYRMRLERVLPALFRFLGLRYRKIDGRMTAHKVAVATEGVLAAWSRAAVFSADFLAALRAEIFDTHETAVQVLQTTEKSECKGLVHGFQ